MTKIDKEMKKKGAGSTKNEIVTVSPWRKKDIQKIAVIDAKTQKKLPRLVVLSTQTIPMPEKNGFQAIKDSEPKLIHDK